MAIDTIRKLSENQDNVLLIHYSCESFYDRVDGKTPRITSIAVRNLGSGQTSSFSIHKTAEEQGVAINDIHTQYDQLEHNMLAEFFTFVEKHDNYSWVHWNMRDINFGFQAIVHRFKVLGETPRIVEDHKKQDLARLLISIYGLNYINHPRLTNLMKLNKISDLGYMLGKEEATAFEEHNFVALHISTLRKVDVMAGIFQRLTDGILKTYAKWNDIYGFRPFEMIEYIKDLWITSAVYIVGAIASIIGLVLILVKCSNGNL